MPRNLGPGPGAYLLPSTVGYDRHDATRYRNPQYTMRPKNAGGGKPFGPGPQYNVDKTTRFGKESPPAYTMAPRIKGLTLFQTPGPGTYSPEKSPNMKEPRPPVYTISPRVPGLKKFNTPGPNQYSVPTTLGPKVPNKPASAAYSMAAKFNPLGKVRSPGPAQYGGIQPDLYLPKKPQYSMGARLIGVSNKTPTPSPATYLPAFKEKVPGGISFGRRVEKVPYITAEDYMPCVD